MTDRDALVRLQDEVAELRLAIATASSADLPVVEMMVRDNRRRIEAERQLRAVRRWMELAQEVGGVASYHVDLDTGELDWSASTCHIYGFPADVKPSLELWLSRIHPEDRAGVEQNAQAAMTMGEPVNQYYRVIRDGQVRWIHDRGRVEKDASGRPVAVYGVNVDVTEARLEQEALDRREQRFRRTFEFANVGVAHVGLQGQFIRANRHLCELLGRTETELACLTFQEITHPDDLDADLAQLRALVSGEIENYCLEKRYLRPDGSVVWADLSVSMLRRPDGTPEKFIAVVADIAERKRAQERMEMVLGEAGHRTKNLIAVIGAVVSTSARNLKTARELEEALTARLKGMAASHDLLTGKYLTGTTLKRLVQRQLEVFAAFADERIAIKGCEVNIDRRAVHAFGMVIHELATNASKYGALSCSTGSVKITWEVDASGEILSFRWVEANGPPVRSLGKQGFGTRTLERMLTGALGGTASLSLPEAGAMFEACLPLRGLST